MRKKELPKRKDAGFKVPKNYFENLEDRVLQQVNSGDHPGGLPAESAPFGVPTNYFAEFESRLNKRLNKENNRKRVIPLFDKKKRSYVAGIAAVLAIIFYSVVMDRTRSFDYNDLDMMAVENYLLESVEYTSPEEYINAEDFSYATSGQADLDHEAVLEYLQENIEEPALLLNEQ